MRRQISRLVRVVDDLEPQSDEIADSQKRPKSLRIVLVELALAEQPASGCSGFDHHLTKPADPTALRRILETGRE
jgi:hypothetical protein